MFYVFLCLKKNVFKVMASIPANAVCVSQLTGNRLG